MLKIILLIVSTFSVIAVLIPLIRKDLWLFRIFDYPRMQKFIIIGILLILWLIFFRQSDLWYEQLAMISLGISFIFLGYLIYPFSPFGSKMIQNIKSEDGRKKLSVLVSNVYQYNRQFQNLMTLIESRNPDVVFLVETDEIWHKEVILLREEYPYYIEIPKDNTYGLLFYSKLPILYQEINYLIDDEVPSIIVDVEFDNQSVRIFGLHPTPPVPQESMHSTDRDAEILIIGKMAKKHKGPCMVIGDLNDVAWSYTTHLFLKVSGLLDPRHGRGLYSTFHAKYWMLRWPLDHFFISNDFHLVDMNVENSIGSDHFPISICLVLSKVDDAEAEESDADDEKLAHEKIEAGINGDPR